MNSELIASERIIRRRKKGLDAYGGQIVEIRFDTPWGPEGFRVPIWRCSHLHQSSTEAFDCASKKLLTMAGKNNEPKVRQ